MRAVRRSVRNSLVPRSLTPWRTFCSISSVTINGVIETFVEIISSLRLGYCATTKYYCFCNRARHRFHELFCVAQPAPMPVPQSALPPEETLPAVLSGFVQEDRRRTRAPLMLAAARRGSVGREPGAWCCSLVSFRLATDGFFPKSRLTWNIETTEGRGLASYSLLAKKMLRNIDWLVRLFLI